MKYDFNTKGGIIFNTGIKQWIIYCIGASHALSLFRIIPNFTKQRTYECIYQYIPRHTVVIHFHNTTVTFKTPQNSAPRIWILPSKMEISCLEKANLAPKNCNNTQHSKLASGFCAQKLQFQCSWNGNAALRNGNSAVTVSSAHTTNN